MKLLTKNTDYAVRALICLAREKGRYVSSREIAEREKIPLSYLRRLLQDLAREGLVSSREGAGGGVRLAGDPGRIELIRLIGIFQGKLDLAECLFRNHVCPNRSRCPLRRQLKKIEENVLADLAGITIGGLVRDVEGVSHEEKGNQD
ncbi:MAG: Rrf2 family transcriptional regulator [PVC group bacterium]